ncbi:replicase associated polyprotein [Citrus yellow spot virus]|nr:replicase associated polyprotein [Citrus yellow spot virus]
MAMISQKTGIEKIIGNFEKSDIKSIFQPAVEYIRDNAPFRAKHFAFEMHPNLKMMIEKIGIELYPNSFKPHSHPFCKTLENHMIFDVLPGVIGDRRWIFISIKQAKVQTIIKRTGSKEGNLSFINRVIDAKDCGRYDMMPEEMGCSTFLDQEERIFSNNFMRRLNSKECIFVHDEVHHWTQKNIFNFLKKVSPKRLLFTIVYPPELLKGICRSQNPSVYEFQVVGEKIHFFPDGVKVEGYEQQKNLEWLFRGRKLRSGDRCWTIRRIKSCYAHHLFEIVQGDLITEDVRYFDHFNTVDLSIIHQNRFRLYDYIPLRIDHLYKVYSYLICLKKPDKQSGLAKLRQIMGDEVNPQVTIFFEKFIERVIDGNGRWNLFGFSLLEKFSEMFLSSLPTCIQRAFPSWAHKNIFEFMFKLEKLNVEVKTIDVYEDIALKFFSKIVKIDFFGCDNLIEIMDIAEDSGWNVGSPPEVISSLRWQIPEPEIKGRFWVRRHFTCRFSSNLNLGVDSNLIEFNEEWKSSSSNLKSKLIPFVFNSIIWREYDLIESSKIVNKFDGEISNLNVYEQLNIFEDYFERESTLPSDDLIERRMMKEIIESLPEEEWNASTFDKSPKFGVSNSELLVSIEKKESGLHARCDEKQKVRAVAINSGGDSHITVNSIFGFEDILDESSFVSAPGSPTGSNSNEIEVPSTEHDDLISKVFENFDEGKTCKWLHLSIIDVPSDGSCFFHAVKIGVGFDQSASFLRNILVQALIVKGMTNLANEMSSPGRFVEAECIPIFCEAAEIELCIHQDDEEKNSFHYNKGGKFKSWCLLNKGDHFQVIKCSEPVPVNYCTNSDVDLLNMDCSADCLDLGNYKIEIKKMSEELSIKFDPSWRCTKFGGRKSAFFGRYGFIDYGHNNVRYFTNKWEERFDAIINSIGDGNSFNAVLIQEYVAGGKIGFHSDNEKCYNDDPILTVNLFGSSLFSFRRKADGKVFKVRLENNSYFIMPSGFQRSFQHSIKSEDNGRTSLTFRLHVRDMSGAPVDRKLIKMEAVKKGCLIRAIADDLGQRADLIMDKLYREDEVYWHEWATRGSGSSELDVDKVASDFSSTIKLAKNGEVKIFDHGSKMRINISYDDNHFRPGISRSNQVETFVSRNFEGGSRINLKKEIEVVLGNLENCTEISYMAEKDRARKLIKSFMSLNTGVSLGEVLHDSKKFFLPISKEIESEDEIGSEIFCISGFAGSGKSRQLQNFFKGRRMGGNFVIISPRNNLAYDWEAKIGAEKGSRKVVTFESAIKLNFSKMDVIVLDEITLFPPGYLDLMMYKAKSAKSNPIFVLIFCPFQARYFNESDIHLLPDNHDVDKIIEGNSFNYSAYSYRLSKKFFSRFFGGIECLGEGEEEGDYWIFPDPMTARIMSAQKGLVADVMLVDSFLEKQSYGEAIRTMTFGESQGMTFDHAIIVLSEATLASNEFRWMVALTRSRLRVSFICTNLGGLSEFMEKSENKMICRFLKYEKISRDYMHHLISGKMNMKGPSLGSSDEVDREDRLEGDLWLKPFIFLGQRFEFEEPDLEGVLAEEPKMGTHLFISEPNFDNAYNFDLIRLKEEREFRCEMEVTNQFADSYERKHPNMKVHTAGPLKFESIYPRHRANDDMTFWMAVKKRLKFREPAENYQRLENAHLIGGILYRNWKRKLGLEFTHDQQLLERCRNDFEVKKLQKSKSTIASHSSRSDVDWALNDVMLFMKSQLCTKYEKQFVDAKAGQTLACFQHLILVEFAPWCRYIEEMIRGQLPDNIYIHSNKNFDDLNEWCVRHFRDDICVESDYESFDASQDEYILSFEMFLMKDCGIPEQVIDSYVKLKCELGCRLGNFAIMRFTGEFCTFLFNTVANMAFTLARYEWKGDEPIAFAGDDMCALSNLTIRTDLEEIFEKISLKAKVDRVTTPTFCGWYLSKYGIVKKPELVHNRFMIAVEEGKVIECLENYAIEVSYAYRLGERLFEVLKTEKDWQYHQNVVRFIVKHLSKLKTSVKQLFEEQSSDEDL